MESQQKWKGVEHSCELPCFDHRVTRKNVAAGLVRKLRKMTGPCQKKNRLPGATGSQREGPNSSLAPRPLHDWLCLVHRRLAYASDLIDDWLALACTLVPLPTRQSPVAVRLPTKETRGARSPPCLGVSLALASWAKRQTHSTMRKITVVETKKKNGRRRARTQTADRRGPARPTFGSDLRTTGNPTTSPA